MILFAVFAMVAHYIHLFFSDYYKFFSNSKNLMGELYIIYEKAVFICIIY